MDKGYAASSESISRDLITAVWKGGKDQMTGCVVLPESEFNFTSADIRISKVAYEILCEQIGREELIHRIQLILDYLKKTSGLNYWVDGENLSEWEHIHVSPARRNKSTLSIWARLRKTKSRGDEARFWMM